MNTIKNVNIKELDLNEDTKRKVIFLLHNGFNVYFADSPIRWECDKKDKFTSFTFEKEGIFAHYGKSGGFDWLFSTSTEHKPNRSTGHGWQVFEGEHITNQQLVETWEESFINIQSGREQNHDKLAYDLYFWDLLKVEL